MRPSVFTRVFPLITGDETVSREHVLLVNGLYKAYDVVPAEIGAALTADGTDIPVALTERLARRGHLTELTPEGETEELRFLAKLVRQVAKNWLSVNLMPTYDCNFRCPYCFESHRLKNGDEWLSKTMPPELLEAVFRMIEAYSSRNVRIHKLNLYGGEPLLEENYDLIEDICRRCNKLGISIEAVSNGYDADRYIDLMTSSRFSYVQISVDGYGELTDRFRRHRDGNGTYEQIMRNVELLYDNGISVCLWINTDRNRLPHIGKMVDDIRRRGLQDLPGRFVFRVRPVVSSQAKEMPVTGDEILAALMDAGMSASEAKRHIAHYGLRWDAILNEMKKDRLPALCPYRCRAHNSGQFCFDPFGKVYSCTRVVGLPDAAIGHIDVKSAKLVPSINGLLWDKRDVSTLKKCQTCSYAMLCGGGCAERAKVYTGSYFNENCSGIDEVYSYVFPRVAGERWQPGLDEELSLSWAEPLSRIPYGEKQRFINSTSSSEQKSILDKYDWTAWGI